MELDLDIIALEQEAQAAGFEAPSLLDHRTVTIDHQSLTVVVLTGLRAMLEAAGDLLDWTTVYEAVSQSLSDVPEGYCDLATAAAVLDEVLAQPVSTTSPRALYAVFAGLGSVCEDLDLDRQALVAYRRALRYSLETNDPALIGCARGWLMRLSTQQRRPFLAEARRAAADDCTRSILVSAPCRAFDPVGMC